MVNKTEFRAFGFFSVDLSTISPFLAPVITYIAFVVLTTVVMNSTILWDREATEEVDFETHNYFVA
jgi:hypothetical protein